MYAIKIIHSYDDGAYNVPDDQIVCVTPSREAAEQIAEEYHPQGRYYLRGDELAPPRPMVIGVNSATATRYGQYASYQDWLERSERGRVLQADRAN